MENKALENLAKIGQLKAEAFSQSEFDAMRMRKDCPSRAGSFLRMEQPMPFLWLRCADKLIDPQTAISSFNACRIRSASTRRHGVCSPMPMMCATALNTKAAMK
jgi:hypothetical protein